MVNGQKIIETILKHTNALIRLRARLDIRAFIIHDEVVQIAIQSLFAVATHDEDKKWMQR